MEPRVAPRAARHPADKARGGSIFPICDRQATQLRRDGSPLECSEGFATGCKAGQRVVTVEFQEGNYSREIWRLQYSQNRAASAPPPDPSGTTGGGGAPLSCPLR